MGDAVIPVRVPAKTKPQLASSNRFTVGPDHPMCATECPGCGVPLGYPADNPPQCVLVFAGIEPGRRKPSGWTTGGAVVVHAMCAGVPEREQAGELDG